MNLFKKLFFILLSLMVFSGFAIAQPPPPIAKPEDSSVKVYQEPSLKDLALTEKFSSADGRFTINLPKSISGFSAITPQMTDNTLSGSLYQWRIKEGAVVITFGDFVDKNFNLKTEQDYVNYFAGVAEGSLSALKAKPINLSKIKLNNHRGIKIDFEMPNGLKGTYRNFLVGKRQYSLMAVFAEDNPDAERLINKSFDSLTIISESAIAEELQRQIEKSTPPMLPQEPVAKKEKSDAEDDNLKGKVKTVTEESEDLSGTWSVQGRHNDSITDFNENGNYLKRLFFDSTGLPFEVTVFGYIDGARVRKSATIENPSNPPIMAIGSTGTKEKSKSDSRYSYKHDFKYTNGKLAEETWIFNDGSLWLRYVYNYQGNQLEMLVYSANGKLNQKYISVLDDKGNEIEKTNVNVLGINSDGDRKYSIKYDSYDEKGNWTKKTESKLVTENGKKIYKPIAVYYRTISYYP